MRVTCIWKSLQRDGAFGTHTPRLPHRFRLLLSLFPNQAPLMEVCSMILPHPLEPNAEVTAW